MLSLDTRSPDALKFFFSYEYPQNLTIVSADGVNTGSEEWNPEAYDSVVVYQNRRLAGFLSQSYGQPYYDLSGIAGAGRLLYDEGSTTVHLLERS